ncbi:MAG: histone deacetylase [Firmicutes bacterium]|nr:histone deacetylase [Bacillota bacterium]
MVEPKPKVGLVFFPAFDWAISPDHPERQERLLYTRDQIQEEGLLDHPSIREFRPRLASDEEILRTHIVLPTLSQQVTESHRIAAGGTIVAADLILDGVVKRAFALLRPPGHHANRVVHGSRGFCLLNNEAVMVDHLRHRLGPDVRIAIVDTDAHHGDGTQDVFYNDPGVLHISLHQDGRTLYPGTGFPQEQGGPGAFGQTVNIPLPPGTGDEGMLMAMERVVLPILEEWEPDYIINAAGQDNHFSDPITNMSFSAHGYAQLTDLLKPDLVVLEGGYSIEDALPYINAGLLLALAGLDYSKIQEPQGRPGALQSSSITRQVAEICDEVLGLWQKRNKVTRSDIFGAGSFFERRRQIYYDTDNIYESQQEYIRLCSDCPGWRVIYTTSTRVAIPVAAVLTSWQTCPSCQKEAENHYHSTIKEDQFGQVIWQDSSQGYSTWTSSTC